MLFVREPKPALDKVWAQYKKEATHSTGQQTHGKGYRSSTTMIGDSKVIMKRAVEPEQDFITCGDCQREFVLSDIVRFIQHKVNRCNKENVEPDFPNNTDYGNCDDDQDDDDNPVSVINSRRTSVSISAPIREKMSPKPSLVSTTQHGDLLPRRDKSRPEDINAENEFRSNSNNDQLQAHNEDVKDAKPKYIDAEANTVYSEPSSFICGTCKSEYSSSWFLMQHAQTKHCLKIYIDPAAHCPPTHSPDRLASTESSHGAEKDSSSSPCLEPQRDATPTSQSSLSMHSKTPNQQSPQRQNSSPAGGPNVFNTSMTSPFLLGPRRPSIPPPFGHSSFNRPPGMGAEYPPGAPGFDHFLRPSFRAMYGSDPQQVIGSPYEASNFLDSFSVRLRQLAKTDPAKAFSSESSAFNPPGSSSKGGSSQMVVADNSSSSGGSQRLKACEFCGKSFRFPSNLIVHRRSHTGEKPYKCPLCSHACTQASKLKRHMKTHNKALFGFPNPSNLSTNSDGSVRSSTSTPDSKLSKLDDDDETDEEELDEEAAAAREAEAEEELRRLHEQVAAAAAAAAAARDEERPTDLSQGRPPSKPVEVEERPTDLSTSKVNRGSLLKEIMDQTAFGNIEQYKEAYNQAMAENSVGSEEDGRDKDEDELDEEEEEMEDPMENGLDGSEAGEDKMNMRALDSRSDATEDGPETKRIKVEPADETYATSRVSTASKDVRLPSYLDAAYSRDRFLRDTQTYREQATGLYPGIWFPPAASAAPDMYPFVSGELLRHAPGVHSLQQNGLKPDTSALKNGSKPGNSLNPMVRRPMPSNGSNSGSSIPGISPVRRRNDTCEFCGKVFRNCSNLTVHRRSHTGEKPYKCRMCSYACAQSSKLTRHMRTHGRFGKDVFNCKFCNMPFSVPSTLEKHMRKCVENRHRGPVMLDDSVNLANHSSHSPPSMVRPSLHGEAGTMPALVSPLGSPLAISSAMSSTATSPVLSASHRSSVLGDFHGEAGAMPSVVSPLGSPSAINSAMSSTATSPVLSVSRRSSMLGDATPESSPVPGSPSHSINKQSTAGSPVASSPLPGLDSSLTTAVAHTSPAVGTA